MLISSKVRFIKRRNTPNLNITRIWVKFYLASFTAEHLLPTIWAPGRLTRCISLVKLSVIFVFSHFLDRQSKAKFNLELFFQLGLIVVWKTSIICLQTKMQPCPSFFPSQLKRREKYFCKKCKFRIKLVWKRDKELIYQSYASWYHSTLPQLSRFLQLRVLLKGEGGEGVQNVEYNSLNFICKTYAKICCIFITEK